MSGRKWLETFWTEDRVEKLKRMLADGDSSGAIGRELGCTRNAVIGKATRMGIMRPGRIVVVTPRQKKPRKPWKQKVALLRPVPEEKPIDDSVVSSETVEIVAARGVVVHGRGSTMGWSRGMVPLGSVAEKELSAVTWTNEVTRTMACLECLQHHMCRWPVQSEPAQFCGAQRVRYNNRSDLSPYCARHYERSRSRLSKGDRE